jgi:hypothetical protein
MATINLAKISTRAPKGLNKEKIKAKTALLLEELDELQNLLFAESKHSVLVVIQGMDASGKDGVIRNVFGKLNPQGVRAYSFKVPTSLELSHDFLWRVHQQAPPKGMIQLFNRSHYEDILVTRVHKWCDDQLAKARMKAINDFEHLLAHHCNTHILKLYLHVSPQFCNGSAYCPAFTERLKINSGTLLRTTPSKCLAVRGEVSIKASPGGLRALLLLETASRRRPQVSGPGHMPLVPRRPGDMPGHMPSWR